MSEGPPEVESLDRKAAGCEQEPVKRAGHRLKFWGPVLSRPAEAWDLRAAGVPGGAGEERGNPHPEQESDCQAGAL